MRALLFILSTCVLSACSSATEAESFGSVLGLSSGTSFGFCAGYCTTELVMDSALVTFIESSRDSVRYPPRRRTLQLSQADFQRLQSLTDPSRLASVAGVNGCPDCADGGSEWIQIRTESAVIRSTFEFGKVLEPIANLQAEVRSVRARFP